MTPNAWLRCYRPQPAARTRLVCLPHAGGNASFFRPWITALPADVELVAVAYPGRLDRLGEAFVDNMTTMVERVCEALTLASDARPLALFGHSMGAAIAYEVAHYLSREGGAEPSHLVVSGREPPEHHKPGVVHLGDDDAIWAEVRRLGGADEDALAVPDLRRLAAPAIRADYRLIETYRPTPRPPLSIPITALVADDDPEVSVAEAGDWRNHTNAGFQLRVYSGDHFYLVGHQAEVVEEVVTRLAA